MMDETTFAAYQHAWVTSKPYNGTIPENLSTEEQQLFERLNRNLLRLEQERIHYTGLNNI